MQSINITREELWAKQKIAARDINYDIWEEKKQILRNFSHINNSCIFTVDTYKACYNFASDNFTDIFGFNRKLIKNIQYEGDIIEDRIHHDDRNQIINIQINHSRFIYSLPVEKRNDYQNIFQFRMLNSKGKYVNVISRHQVFEKDRNGKAWIVLGIINISPDQTPLEKIKYTTLNIITGEIINQNSHACNLEKILTPREIEILRLIRKGFLSKEIAHILDISIHTVNNHRKNILAKLNADNSIEAINLAYK